MRAWRSWLLVRLPTLPGLIRSKECRPSRSWRDDSGRFGPARRPAQATSAPAWRSYSELRLTEATLGGYSLPPFCAPPRTALLHVADLGLLGLSTNANLRLDADWDVLTPALPHAVRPLNGMGSALLQRCTPAHSSDIGDSTRWKYENLG